MRTINRVRLSLLQSRPVLLNEAVKSASSEALLQEASNSRSRRNSPANVYGSNTVTLVRLVKCRNFSLGDLAFRGRHGEKMEQPDIPQMSGIVPLETVENFFKIVIICGHMSN